MSKYSGSDWDFAMIEDIWEDIVKIAKKYNIDYYEPQIEIISSEQMLDNYSVTGMPVFYPHWSFGKRFTNDKKGYVGGQKGLAFEIVINSNPSICYIMENNTLCLQILVLAHAAVGHSAYFKNNYLFKAHTEADTIIDFLIYGRDYILECETKYGAVKVEKLLDACHALSNFSIDKSVAPKFKSRAFLDALEDAKEKQDLSNVSALWDILFDKRTKAKDNHYNEENILRFIRDNSNVLNEWEKNIISICMYINQYFYPQMQTQVGNEGFATFWHYTLMHDMYEADLIDDGIMLEFLDNHNAVIRQSVAFFKDEHGNVQQNANYSGINPYCLGFAMFKDIRRICENPDERDKELMGHLIGKDWVDAVKDAAYNYNDSSFINQFLSPKVIDDLKLLYLTDDTDDMHYDITGTSAESSYKDIRKALSNQYDLQLRLPQLHIGNKISNQIGNEPLILVYNPTNNRDLHDMGAKKTMAFIRKLWGHSVIIMEDKNLEIDGAKLTIPKVLHRVI
jgi:spore cortex formation protein SpoVR/YcgB (stage V sporulation)